MLDFFDIFGTPIPYAEIKDFRIVQREYIYRPVYEEVIYLDKRVFKHEQKTEYRYIQMEPYAAIIDESDRRWIFSGKAKTAKEHVGLELLNDVRETIGDKFKLKAVKGKRYLCMKQTGRVFQMYLDEIPVLVKMNDGRIVEVNKDTDLYKQLGESILPAINIVPALIIRANENYIFWGNGIQIDNIGYEYKRLQTEISEYKHGNILETKERKAIEKKSFQIPKILTLGKQKEPISDVFDNDITLD